MEDSVWGLSSCDWSFHSFGPGDEFGVAVLAVKVVGWASWAICSKAKRRGMASKCGSRPVRIQAWCIWAQWKVWLPSFRRTVKAWEGGDVSCQWTTNGCCYCKDSCWGVFLLPLLYWLLWAMQMPYAILTFSFFATMWICSGLIHKNDITLLAFPFRSTGMQPYLLHLCLMKIQYLELRCNTLLTSMVVCAFILYPAWIFAVG